MKGFLLVLVGSESVLGGASRCFCLAVVLPAASPPGGHDLAAYPSNPTGLRVLFRFPSLVFPCYSCYFRGICCPFLFFLFFFFLTLFLFHCFGCWRAYIPGTIYQGMYVVPVVSSTMVWHDFVYSLYSIITMYSVQ